MKSFCWGLDHLTPELAIDLLDGRCKTVLEQATIDKLETSRKVIDLIAGSKKPVYGVNTGFGPLCDTQISSAEASKLQTNLLLTHAVGVGGSIDRRLSQLMLICKIHALCQGYSGIRLLVVRRLLLLLELDLIPVVPQQGSVGASGDLAPLAHLFLPLIGEGELWVEGKIQATAEAMKTFGIEPIRLEAKEGLALINGTQFILAHAIWGLHRMKYLLDLADLAGAMTLEGYQGSQSPFHAAVHQVRPFDGCILVAARMRSLLTGSENMRTHTDCSRVQDPYSLRCIAQVHGASRNAYEHVHALSTIELNSVTDNPIVISEGEVISGGNFHGQPLAMALDYVSIAAAELGNISDRRCYLLLEGKHGLPRFLTVEGGLNSGLMIPQYTTAALVTENKSLCFPTSADSIPTALGQEDHVSMGSISGRQFNQILGNLEKILAIELLYAAQALDFRRPNHFSEVIEENLQLIRNLVPALKEDRLLKDDIANMIRLVYERTLKVNLDLSS